jgi:hypothetical protein
MGDLRIIALHLFGGVHAKIPVFPAGNARIHGYPGRLDSSGREKPSVVMVPV